jgi:hypothetical protein
MSSAENREEWIIRRAQELPASERATFIEKACGGDNSLRERVETLRRFEEGLCAHAQPENITDETLPDPKLLRERFLEQAGESPDEAVGRVIGRYRLMEKIGEGGFGAVYIAEQKEPVKRGWR